MNSLMLPIFTLQTSQWGLSLLMQNLPCAGQALIAFFLKFLTESRPECALPKRSAPPRAKDLLRQAPRPSPAVKKRIACAPSVPLPHATMHPQKSLSTREGNNTATRNCQRGQAARAKEARDLRQHVARR